MRAAWMLLLPIISLSSCIIYPWDRHHRGDGPRDDGDALIPDTAFVVETDQPEQPAPSPFDVRLHPSGAVRGDTVISSLIDHSDPPLDLSTVTDVDLIGPSRVEVLAVQVRDDREVLVTLRVPPRRALGHNDAIVTFADGSGVFLADAFVVVDDPQDVPPDAWTGDPVDTVDTTPVDTTDTTPVDTTDTTPVDTTDTTAP